MKEDDEAFNLKNKKCQQLFKEYTSNTNFLSSVFDQDDDLNKLTIKFIKKLNGCIAKNFTKVRIKKKKIDRKEQLYKKLRELKNNDDENSRKEIKVIEEEIAEHIEENYRKIQNELKPMESNDGDLKPNKLWQLKKKLCPNSRDPPSAMLDSQGNLLTSVKAIEDRALEVYSKRLKPNEMKDDLLEYESDTNKMCETRMKLCQLNKTEPWDEEDLKIVLTELKKNKSRDADGLANELFKEAAGTDLLKAVLKLMNLMKEKQIFPEVLEKCNITSIHKKKAKNDFLNYRGVFRVTVLRSILDRLIYNSTYETIDSHLTDGNVGARKRRGCRDNIFVLSAISNSIINGKCEPIQLQVTDVQTCFDKM